jgi:hypothetical protein
MHMAAATPECKATNDAFLTTLAWCFHTHCPDIKNSTLERVWEMDIVGRKKVQPSPKYSYQVALALAHESPPTEIVDSEAVLNKTSLVDEAVWQSNFNADYVFEKMEAVTEKYGQVSFPSLSVPFLDFKLTESQHHFNGHLRRSSHPPLLE